MSQTGFESNCYTPRRDPTSPYRRKRLPAFYVSRLRVLRILTRSWRFLILRWGLSPLGWSWRSEGYHLVAFLAFRGTLGPPFGGLGVALGMHFGGLGVPLGAFSAQSSQKTPWPFQRRLVFSDFDAQRVSRRLPKWS